MRYCKDCDKTYPDDSKFCKDCGKNLTELVEKPVEETKPTTHREFVIPYTKLILIAVAIGLVLLAGSMTGLFSLPSPININNPPSTTVGTTSPPTTVLTTSIATTTAIPKFDISVKVINEYTNEPIEGAIIYLDDSDIGVTEQYGTKVIKDILEGSYNLRACHPTYRDICTKTPIEVSSFSNFEVKIKAPIDIKLTIKDTGTNKLVEDVTVSLEDRNGNIKQTTSTTQKGTVLAKDIIPGEYRAGIHIKVGVKDYPIYSDYVELKNDEETIELKMPEPDFSNSAYRFDISYDYLIDEKGKCVVKAVNTGDIQSEFTVAVCLVYEINKTSGKPKPEPIGGDTIVFGSVMEHTETSYKESQKFNTHKATEEDVVIVFYDTYDYVSQKDWSKQISISNSVVEDWILEAKEFCSQDPERCAKVAGIVVGTAIKTATGGGG